MNKVINSHFNIAVDTLLVTALVCGQFKSVIAFLKRRTRFYNYHSRLPASCGIIRSVKQLFNRVFIGFHIEIPR